MAESELKYKKTTHLIIIKNITYPKKNDLLENKNKLTG
jgi:hypothetical protein